MSKPKKTASRDLVTYGKAKIVGAVYCAPTTATLPTDATSDLAEDFINLGFVSEDGLKNTFSPESESVKAWGGAKVLELFKERPDTYTFTLIEAKNIEVLKLVHGESNVSGDLTSGITVKGNAEPLKDHAFVFEILFKDAIKRIVLPCASVQSVGEVAYKDSEAVGYEITLSALENADGDTHYQYIKAV